MANSFTQLRHYPKLDDSTVVFSSIWGLVQSGTTDPVTNNPETINLDLSVGDRVKTSLSLGKGLTWNADTKQISVEILNEQTRFVADEMEVEYALYVVWDYGQAQTLREGFVTGVRVG